MSLPSTGKVRARLFGETLLFNGEVWTEGPSSFLALLNAQTAGYTATHITAVDAAKKILASLSTDWEILEAVCDEWETDLPEGAID